MKPNSRNPLLTDLLIMVGCLLLPWFWMRDSFTADCREVLLAENMIHKTTSQPSALEAAALCFPWRTELWEEAARQSGDEGDLNNLIYLLERASQEALRFGSSDRESLSLQSLEALASAYRQRSEYSKSLEVLQTIVARTALNEERAREISRLQLALADFSAASQVWQTLIETEPNNASAHYQLGLLLAAKEPDAAVPVLEEASRLDQNYAAPAASLLQAIKGAGIAEDPAYTLMMAGRALASLSEWGLAAEAFRQSILLRPNYSEAWAFLGEARQHIPASFNAGGSAASPSSDGLFELETAIALDPTSLGAHTLLALYYLRQSELDNALSAIRKAIELSPENPTVISQFASLLADSGDLDQAYEAYQEASQLAPYDPAYTRQIVRFSLEHNYQIEQIALPLARQLILQDPQNPTDLDLMGQIMVSLGDLSNAEKFLIRALRNDQEYAPAHYHLGVVYLLQGDPQLALYHLDAALKLDPGGTTGELALRLLEGGHP